MYIQKERVSKAHMHTLYIFPNTNTFHLASMRKPGLCTPSIHITVSPLLFKILEICKLHEIPYEELHT